MKVTITLNHDEAQWLTLTLFRQLKSDQAEAEQLRKDWEEAGSPMGSWNPKWDFIHVLNDDIFFCESVRNKLMEAQA